MNGALIYRPNNRRLIWMAFVCAVAVHVTAVVLAENRSKPMLLGTIPFTDDVIGVDVPPSDSEEIDMSAPDQPAITDEQDFYEEKMMAPIRARKKIPVTPIRSNAGMREASAKALALFAPRPSYPYEARRGGITGSGIAQLTVNSAAGNVIDAQMLQSTGSPILDNATVSAFRRWRFKPGVASNVDVPITYTLTGVSY